MEVEKVAQTNAKSHLRIDATIAFEIWTWLTPDLGNDWNFCNSRTGCNVFMGWLAQRANPLSTIAKLLHKAAIPRRRRSAIQDSDSRIPEELIES